MAEEIAEKKGQSIEDFLNDPENKLKAEASAKQIIDLVGSNWFSLRKLKAKTGYSEVDLIEKLKVLESFEVLVSKKEGALMNYRVDLNKAQLKKLIELDLQYLDAQKQILLKRLEQLQKEGD